MLVSDFKMNSRLKNTQGTFSGIHGMPLLRMHRKRTLWHTTGIVTPYTHYYHQIASYQVRVLWI